MDDHHHPLRVRGAHRRPWDLLQQDPFKKLISIGIIYGGVIPFVVDRGYLDVAIVVSLIIPISTIIILPLMRRDIRDA